MPVVVMVAITSILHPLLIIWDMVRTEAKLVTVAMWEVLVSWSSDTVTCVLHVQLGLMLQLGAQHYQIAPATPGLQDLVTPKHAHLVPQAQSYGTIYASRARQAPQAPTASRAFATLEQVGLMGVHALIVPSIP